MPAEPYTIPSTNEAGELNPVPQDHEEAPVTTEEEETNTKENKTGGTSPKQGSTILATFPNFLKKSFEKKPQHEDVPADTTETSDGTADTNNPTTQDKSEKRLSRTLFDLIHKKSNKPDTQAEVQGTANGGHEHQTTEQEATPPSYPSKEPFIGHLRKLIFAKKPADGDHASSDNNNNDTNAPISDNTNVTENDDHPTTDLPANEESKPTLSRRLSKMAQNLTSRIKDNNSNKKSTKAVASPEDTVDDPVTTTQDDNVAPTVEEAAAIPLPSSAPNNDLSVPT
ncbi:hypothetical protein BC941DRAFT_408924 [Chlamydoabsidia padenii]|nr:hypothetical protein BC941DRAFT_408924 [Chlamydoabsidia padenii]